MDCCHQCCGTDAVVAQRASTRSTVPSGHCAVKLYHGIVHGVDWTLRTGPDHAVKGVPGGSPCRIWRNFRDDVARTSLGYTLAQYTPVRTAWCRMTCSTRTKNVCASQCLAVWDTTFSP